MRAGLVRRSHRSVCEIANWEDTRTSLELVETVPAFLAFGGGAAEVDALAGSGAEAGVEAPEPEGEF